MNVSLYPLAAVRQHGKPTASAVQILMFEPRSEYFPVRKLAPGVTLDDLKIPSDLLKTQE